MRRRLCLCLPALAAIALPACTSAPRTVLPLRWDKDAPNARSGEPRRRQLAPGSPVEWWTAEGEALGLPDRGPVLFRYPSYYEKVNYVFRQWQTTTGHFVAEGAQPDTWLIAIMVPDKSDSIRWEVYGPTLKSVRASRWVEKLHLKDGGDVIYFTREGTSRASQLGD